MRNIFKCAAIAAAGICLVAGGPVFADETEPSTQRLVAPLLTMKTAGQPLSVAPAVVSSSDDTLTGKVEAVQLADATDEQLRCLATAIYFEARSEPIEGQLAVAQVIKNRTRSGRFPTSLCGVVYQPSQFSFSRRRTPDNAAQWQRARKVAMVAMAESWREVAPAALYFHAARVSPDWNAKRVARIGNHIFYR